MYKFKDFEDYKNQRDAILDSAKEMLEAGQMDEYKAKTAEVDQIDAAYEAYATEKANLEAMKGAVKPPLSVTGVKGVVETVNMDDELEYRKAFMNYVIAGTPIKMSNADATTVAADVGAVIPNTILNKIIEKMEKTGNILAKVTQTYYKGGVTVPTSAAKPTATWTTERGTTDKQKKATGSITFTYYKLKVQVAMSIIVDNVTLDIFEKTLIQNIAEAMTKELERTIINGTGEGQPKGIIAEDVVDGQKVEIAKGKKITYEDLCTAEGLLPSAYDDAEWCMKKSTFMTQIMGMVDLNGQPIARINAGINGKPEYTILGRHVEFSEDVPAFPAAATEDTTVAFLFRFADYMLNTNLGVTVSRYTDQETDDEITKAIMLADGKVVDAHSLVKINVKKAS